MTRRELLLTVGLVVGFFALVATGWVVQSHFEAKSYNRLTGQNVTTWDAMFIECRVIGEPQ